MLFKSIFLRAAAQSLMKPGHFYSVLIASLIVSVCGIAYITYLPEAPAYLVYGTALSSFVHGFYIIILAQRQSILSFSMLEYLVDNQEKVADENELAFFMREAESEGFGAEFREYLNHLDKKPRIRDCMLKAMELKEKSEIGA